MSELLREATPEERRLYYSREWDAKKLPEFIVKSIERREFGFDHTGEGGQATGRTHSQTSETLRIT